VGSGLTSKTEYNLSSEPGNLLHGILNRHQSIPTSATPSNYTQVVGVPPNFVERLEEKSFHREAMQQPNNVMADSLRMR